MKDALTSLRMQKRKVEGRVTNENKQKVINQINKNSSDYGYGKISKNASVSEVTRMKKQYEERLTYDIVNLAVQEGKGIIAEIEGRALKKSDDYEVKRLGEFAKQLAQAKKQSMSKLSKQEVAFLERGNSNIKGYGNEDIITLFEKTHTKGQAQKLIDEIRSQNAKEIFYNKQLDIFERVFQKVNIVRADDIEKIKEKIKSMDFQSALNHTNELIKSLEMYGSDQKQAGSIEDETELKNARLDDMMSRLGMNTKTSQKQIKKTMDKYKSQYNSKTGFIFD